MIALATKHERDDMWSSRAKEKERQLDWRGAAFTYRRSAREHLSSKNFVKAGEFKKELGNVSFSLFPLVTLICFPVSRWYRK